MKTCCRPGEMLCASCMSEEEDPPTQRIPRREDSWNLLPVVQGRPFNPAAMFNLPKLRKTPLFIPIYEDHSV